MSTTFHHQINEVSYGSTSSTVTLARSADDPTITVANGAVFGRFPLVVTPIRNQVILCILNVTARSGNVLTVSGAIEGTTDVALVAGDTITHAATAGAVLEIQAAVNAAETTLAGKAADNAVVHLTGNETIAGTKTFSSPIAGSITGNIDESQVTNLPSDLSTLNGAIATNSAAIATKAADNAVVHLTGNETVAGTKTFSSPIAGSVTGNAATATNGVVTTGSYADPAWITSLDGAKLAGTVIATNGVVTSGSYADPVWITSLDKAKIGLGNVENTALSTWAGSTAIVTVGTIATGTWHGTPIADTYIASASAWNAKADDSAVLHNTGDEMATGVKTFTGNLQLGGGQITFISDVGTFNNYGFGRFGGKLLFFPGSDGILINSFDNLANLFRLTNDGDLGLFAATPLGRIHAIAKSTTTPILVTEALYAQTAPHHIFRGISTSAYREIAYIDAGFNQLIDATFTGYAVVDANSWNGRESGLRVDATGTGANVSLFSGTAGSYGGGVGCLFVPNGTTVPTSNPTGGGLLYVEGGALKFRGSSGTISTVAPA